MGLPSLKWQRSEAHRPTRQRNVIHDDVFVERLDEGLADHRVRDAEQTVSQAIGFNFSQNVALRIQQKGYRPVRRRKIFYVVGENRIQIADALGTKEGEIAAAILVYPPPGPCLKPLFQLP